MNHKLIFTVAAMAAAVVFPGSAIAQARVNQFTDKRVSGASGPVTRANFGQFVASSGFPITRASDDSHYTFTVQVAGKPTTFSAWLLDELTPSRISITAPLLTLKDEASAPAWVTQRLLIANNNNAPVFFAFSNCTSNSCRYVLRAQVLMENSAPDSNLFGVSLTKMVKAIEATQDLWDSSRWTRR
jgi:hypothetical protein